MQALIDEMSARMRYERVVTGQNMSLGKFIEALEGIDDKTIQVRMSDGRTPCDVDSYRGYYSDLAISTKQGGQMNVAGLLELLRGALGQTFQGYKGGDYTMGPHTPLWVAEYGSCGDAVQGLRVADDLVVIVSAPVD
jgi:hypothetical protein